MPLPEFPSDKYEKVVHPMGELLSEYMEKIKEHVSVEDGEQHAGIPTYRLGSSVFKRNGKEYRIVCKIQPILKVLEIKY